LCAIAGVSRAAFYKYKQRELPPASDIEEKIIDLYKKSGRKFGYRMIKLRLKVVYKLTVNHKKIRRIMRAHELRSIVRPKYRKPPQDDVFIVPNILNRDFKASRPYEKLVTDITYIPTPHKMMYLSTVIDLFDNYPVAWHLSDCQDKRLSIDTIMKLPHMEGALLHSDRGIHYTNKDFRNLLDQLGVQQSMSRKGNCWDNACAESFFSQYKCECIYLNKGRLRKPSDVIEVTAEYFDYYINERPQMKLGGMTPSEYRLAYQNS
jgi:transposase InsO family protein